MFPGGGGLFGMMDQMMNDMMRMNQNLMNDSFFQGVPMAQQQHQVPHTNPTIEEIPADAPYHQEAARQGSGPIVEEPDEGLSPAQEQPQYHSSRHSQQQHRAAPRAPVAPQPSHPAPPAVNNMLGMPMMSPFGGLFESMLGNMGSGMSMNMQSSGSGGGQVYSYSSTQVYTSGPNGVYHSSSTSRQGPGGVRETQKTIRDGRTGHESMTIARGIGDRECVVSRTRDASGHMHSSERHTGLDPTHAHDFDQEWTQQAAQALPSWMNSGSQQQQRVGGVGQRQQQQLALPPAQQYAQQQQQGGVYGQQYQQQQRNVNQGYGGNGGGWSGGYHV